MNPTSAGRGRHTIGVFDSGVGGLSVLRAILEILPDENLLYLADQAHVPYGSRPLEEVRTFSEGITRFLLEHGADVVVVACNTASAAALHHLRQTFPAVPFVGMEPAVKPAAEQTQTGVVGVLATPATFQGELYASVVERFGGNVRLLQDTCPGLVAEIERGNLHGRETKEILKKAIEPMLASQIDTIVLGCTHYPFIIPLIEDLAGESVRVIDPAPAVARQTARLLDAIDACQTLTRKPDRKMYTTGDKRVFQQQLQALIGRSWETSRASWDETHHALTVRE